MKNAISSIVLLIIGLVLVYNFAPGLWSQGERVYREKMGWTPEARRANPVGYLKYSRDTLQSNIDKITGIVQNLELQARSVEKEHKKVVEEQSKYEELLNRARSLYKEAGKEGGSGYPVKFLGSSYKQDQFLKQIEIIFERNEQAKKRIDGGKKANDNILKALTEMYERKAKAKGALEDIETSIVIAQANAAASEVATTMDHVADVVEDMDVFLGDYESGRMPIADADVLLKKMDSTGTGSKAMMDFLSE